MIGLGTLINVITISIGSTVGVLSGGRLPQKLRTTLTDILGCVALINAADCLRSVWNPTFTRSVPVGWTTLGTLVALLIGGVIGFFLKIEFHLENFGEFLKRKFANSDGGDKAQFINGFVSASMLFVIGPMAILGSVSDGMHTGIQQLVLKSTLDGFAAMAFASTFGWGVAFSAIPVAVYQLSWTGVGYFLGNILAPYQLAALTSVGGVLLFGIGLRLLGIKSIASGDLLPALVLAPVVALAAHQFIA